MSRPETATWTPRYALTPAIARDLMAIEAARTVVERTPLPPAVEAALRQRVRVRATHYSTRIEGNRLTLAEAEQVVTGRRVRFHGRERDRSEVQHYWVALLRVEEWATAKAPLREGLIQRLHALVERGARAKPTPYRQAQNAIRDSASNALVYLPPEAKDVPALMAGLVGWMNQAERQDLPAPVLAGLAHYQLVTIHPFFDGNGRTARLLATLLLHRGGYGLNGFYSLEEHHASDLSGYYQALTTHPHHNYYLGREQADLTSWLTYFVRALAAVFRAAQGEALRLAAAGVETEPVALQQLDRRARQAFALFATQERITSTDIAQVLGLSLRTARLLLQEWVSAGWLTVLDSANRSRAYGLSADYRQYLGRLSAIAADMEVP